MCVLSNEVDYKLMHNKHTKISKGLYWVGQKGTAILQNVMRLLDSEPLVAGSRLRRLLSCKHRWPVTYVPPFPISSNGECLLRYPIPASPLYSGFVWLITCPF